MTRSMISCYQLMMLQLSSSSAFLRERAPPPPSPPWFFPILPLMRLKSDRAAHDIVHSSIHQFAPISCSANSYQKKKRLPKSAKIEQIIKSVTSLAERDRFKLRSRRQPKSTDHVRYAVRYRVRVRAIRADHSSFLNVNLIPMKQHQ